MMSRITSMLLNLAGGHQEFRASDIYTLIEMCKLNSVDPRAWLADILARIADHPAKRIADLLSWYWRSTLAARAALTPPPAVL